MLYEICPKKFVEFFRSLYRTIDDLFPSGIGGSLALRTRLCNRYLHPTKVCKFHVSFLRRLGRHDHHTKHCQTRPYQLSNHICFVKFSFFYSPLLTIRAQGVTTYFFVTFIGCRQAIYRYWLSI